MQLGRDVAARIVTALVLSRLDYCTAVLLLVQFHLTLLGLSSSFHTGTISETLTGRGTY